MMPDKMFAAADRLRRITAGKEDPRDVYGVTFLVNASQLATQRKLDDERLLASYAVQLLDCQYAIMRMDLDAAGKVPECNDTITAAALVEWGLIQEGNWFNIGMDRLRVYLDGSTAELCQLVNGRWMTVVKHTSKQKLRMLLSLLR